MKWADVPWATNYEVSELGLVRRKQHTGWHQLYGERRFSERPLKPMKNADGYIRVKIKKRLVFVHILVLEAFVGPKPVGMQCCHNNNVRDDNRLVNLRWDTPKNNVHDRRFHGTYQYDERNPNWKHGNSYKRQKRLQEEANSQGRYVLRIEDIS